MANVTAVERFSAASGSESESAASPAHRVVAATPEAAATACVPAGRHECASLESTPAVARRFSLGGGRFSLGVGSSFRRANKPSILRMGPKHRVTDRTSAAPRPRVRFASISHSPVSGELLVPRSPAAVKPHRAAPPPMGKPAALPRMDAGVLMDDGSQPNTERLRELLRAEQGIIGGVALSHVGVLGSGTFGVVYKCKLLERLSGAREQALVDEAGGMVAVKKLRSDAQIRRSAHHSLTVEEIVDFAREIGLMRSLRHGHVLGYVGCGLYLDADGHDQLSLVLEFASGGSLATLINHESAFRRAYGEFDALRWVGEIAAGLAFLHGFRPQVIHRDIKPENVLLCGPGRVAKLADFGLATFERKREKQRHVALAMAAAEADAARADAGLRTDPMCAARLRTPVHTAEALLRARVMSDGDDPRPQLRSPGSEPETRHAPARDAMAAEPGASASPHARVAARPLLRGRANSVEMMGADAGSADGSAHCRSTHQPPARGALPGRPAAPQPLPSAAPPPSTTTAPVSPFRGIDGYHFDVAALRLTGTTGSLRYMVRAAAAATVPHSQPRRRRALTAAPAIVRCPRRAPVLVRAGARELSR